MSYHYALGQWTALFDTAPAAGAGVPLPDGSRFVCQVANVTTDNADNSPAPVWVDISTKVNQLSWLTGDPSGGISRWIIEQFTITTTDLSAVLGDFVDLTASTTSTAPAAGMFARWGFLRASDGVWWPAQSGIVETIEEIIAGRVRGWRLRCFGTLLYMAQVAPSNGQYDLGGVGANLVTACNNVLSTYGWSANITIGWPWASQIAPQDSTLPTTVGVAMIIGSQLGTLHRLADSMGMRVINTRTGGVALEPWGTAVGSGVRFSDEPAATVAGHAPIGGTVAGVPLWKRSPDRCGPMVDLESIYSPGLIWRGLGDELLFTKWGWRSDIVGFPKRDLLGIGTAPYGQNLANYAASLVAKELRLERIDCDTVADPLVWALLTGSVPVGYAPVWTRSTATFERRRPGTTWLEATVLVHAVAGTIEFATGIGRMQISYHTRLV